jgi:GNAT superfamily N-acetyltransferase
LIAEFSFEIIGVIAVRDYNHIALFFVDTPFQRRGVGRELFRKALEICRCNNLGLSQITVNASPNSINAYESMGFQPTDSEQCVNGIRFVPMAWRLPKVDGG